MSELLARAEVAVQACLDVLPLEGAWPNYRVSERVHAEVRALPEEWAEAAHAIAQLCEIVDRTQSGQHVSTHAGLGSP